MFTINFILLLLVILPLPVILLLSVILPLPVILSEAKDLPFNLELFKIICIFEIMVLYLRTNKLKYFDYETYIGDFGRPPYTCICQQG